MPEKKSKRMPKIITNCPHVDRPCQSKGMCSTCYIKSLKILKKKDDTSMKQKLETPTPVKQERVKDSDRVFKITRESSEKVKYDSKD